jgi:hypothetical protein
MGERKGELVRSRQADKTRLTEQQEMAAYYMATGMHREEIAKLCNTTPKSLSVWSNQNDLFKAELAKWRAAEVDRLSDSLANAQLRIIGLTDRAAAVMELAMEERDDEGNPTPRAVKAAVELFRKIPLVAGGEDTNAQQTVAAAAVIVVNMDSEGKLKMPGETIEAEIVEED